MPSKSAGHNVDRFDVRFCPSLKLGDGKLLCLAFVSNELLAIAGGQSQFGRCCRWPFLIAGPFLAAAARVTLNPLAIARALIRRLMVVATPAFDVGKTVVRHASVAARSKRRQLLNVDIPNKEHPSPALLAR